MGGKADQSDRATRRDPVRSGSAEDALGQDHAANLRKIAEGDVSNLGDTTTLADPSVVHDLVKNRKQAK